MKQWIYIKEELYRWIFMIFAFSSLIFLAGIIIILFKESFPVLREVGFIKFIFGKSWYPTYEPPDFGTFPLIMASLWVTVGSLAVCVPLGVGSALFLSELATPLQRSMIKPLIEILAAIPSVIYGFFGMLIIAPFLQNLFNIPVGQCAFTASLMLGIMATPTVCSIAEDAISYVPKSFREASLAMGANKWQTMTRVVIPAAGSGISTAVMLGIGRAVGETMTVLMVAGGSAVIPKSFFLPVRPMTSTIAAEMGEAVMGSQHYHALFGIGFVLFCITLSFSIIAEIISRRYRLKLGAGR